MTSKKILLLLLFAALLACNRQDENTKAEWINNAFETLKSGNYPKIKAIAWWNENFDKSKLRIDSSPESQTAYQNGVSDDVFITKPVFSNDKLQVSNGIYHSAYPDFGGTEDIVTTEAIRDFEQIAGKNIVWAYFSNNWYNDIKFPAEAVQTIHKAGCVPFIRMMPRSDFYENQADPVYTMQKIIDGEFDEQLEQWAKDAANVGFPLLVEFGTEVNGDWFSWNGKYNGAGETSGYGDPNLPDGPERFRDAYRHIINICRQNNATNITWFFHFDADGSPDDDWNDFENYYPGDDYIDWVGISAYGPQEKNEDYREFDDILKNVYPRIIAMTDKPLAILEFALTEI